MLFCTASSATPITVVQGIVSASMRKHWPSASRPGQRARAIDSLTTATRAAAPRAAPISAREAAAANDARAHDVEVFRRRRLVVEASEPLDGIDSRHEEREHARGEWEAVHARGRGDAGNRSSRLEQAIADCGARGRVELETAILRCCDENGLGIPTQTLRSHILETADE